MAGFRVNASSPDSHIEENRTRARVLVENLPSWLEEEIRRDKLSVCDAAAVDQGPAALCDVVVASDEPWPAVKVLAERAKRHLVVAAPSEHSNIATRIEPDFILSSSRTIDCPGRPGLLLVYSRADCFPASPVFDGHVGETRADVSPLGRHEALSRKLGRISVLLENRESELLERSRREHALRSDVEYWKTTADTLDGQIAEQSRIAEDLATELQAAEERLRHEAARLDTVQKHQAAEIQMLASAAAARGIEAAALGRIVTGLETSLSWRITAPLRFLSKPLFRILAGNAAPPDPPREVLQKPAVPAPAPQPAAKPIENIPARAPAAKPPARPIGTGAAPARAPRPAAKPIESVPAPAPDAKPLAKPAGAMTVPAATPEPAADPIETIILPALRRARSIAVVQCAIPFSSTLNQRPISYAKFLADRGYTVLFAEVWRCPEADVHRTGESVYPGVFSIPFYAFDYGIADTLTDNVDRIAAERQAPGLYVCTLPASGSSVVTSSLRAAGYHIHYDIMDDWEEFHRGGEAAWYSAEVERELLAVSDTVTAVSNGLARKFAGRRSDIAVVRNGYEPSALSCQQFIAARAPLAVPKTVGYFGHFSDAWFDWDTLFHAARQRPDLRFELIGNGLSERARIRMSEFSNIRFAGLVPQKDLHRYARKWWAGMIPFRPSAIAAAADPLKIYEYLHFGLPAVVTGVSEIREYPMVSYVEDREAFVQALDRLPGRPDSAILAEVAGFLKHCAWEERLAMLNSIAGRHG